MATVKGPDAFRTISEAAAELDVPQHVLRFWETKFSFIRPMKRAGGRRFYRRQDIDVLRGVRTLLHEQGYTIKGVQRLHKEHGVAHVVAAASGPPSAESLAEPSFEAAAFNAAEIVETVGERELVLDSDTRTHLEAVLEDLESVKARIDRLLG